MEGLKARAWRVAIQWRLLLFLGLISSVAGAAYGSWFSALLNGSAMAGMAAVMLFLYPGSGRMMLILLLTLQTATLADGIWSDDNLGLYLLVFWGLVLGVPIMLFVSARFGLSSPRLPFPVTFMARTRVTGGPMTAFHDGNLQEAVYELVRPSQGNPAFLPYIKKREFDDQVPSQFTDEIRKAFYNIEFSIKTTIREETPYRELRLDSTFDGRLARQRVETLWEILPIPAGRGVVLSITTRITNLPSFTALSLFLTNQFQNDTECIAATIDDRPDRSLWAWFEPRAEKIERSIEHAREKKEMKAQ